MKRIIEKPEINRWLVVLNGIKPENKNAKLWKRVYNLASKPKRQRVSVNLGKIEEYANDLDNVIVPGKILGDGEIRKNINIAAIEYSAQALEKLKGSKCKIVDINEMIKKDAVKIIM